MLGQREPRGSPEERVPMDAWTGLPEVHVWKRGTRGASESAASVPALLPSLPSLQWDLYWSLGEVLNGLSPVQCLTKHLLPLESVPLILSGSPPMAWSSPDTPPLSLLSSRDSILWMAPLPPSCLNLSHHCSCPRDTHSCPLTPPEASTGPFWSGCKFGSLAGSGFKTAEFAIGDSSRQPRSVG